MATKVLLVDSSPFAADQCARVLRDCGCEVTGVSSAAAAAKLLETRKFDAAFIDFRLATQDGNDLLSSIKQAQPAINIILTAQRAGDAPSDHPLRLRGCPLLTVPLRIEEVAQALQNPVNENPEPAQASTAAASAEKLTDLIGSSERMKKIYRLVSKVALQRHPVLIMGESGTGKELVARAIHKLGPWRNQPFVPVDCGAMPPTLIESELFGHVKGAFTGAAQSRQGLLAAAASGTVFLDEIGELPIELQSRLLRTLQEHEIRPLGSNERIRFEARIVAATNQDLEAGIKTGSFRKDLFFRLNVVSIKMPPLRDRKGDIPLLIRHFLKRHGNGNTPLQISDEAMGRLMSYDWPGNVRELENCVQRAVSLGSGPFIQMQDLPSAMLCPLPGGSPSASPQQMSTLQILEEQAIRKALEATGGDRVRAAKMLGIGKTTIYRKLKEYGIDPGDAET